MPAVNSQRPGFVAHRVAGGDPDPHLPVEGEAEVCAVVADRLIRAAGHHGCRALHPLPLGDHRQPAVDRSGRPADSGGRFDLPIVAIDPAPRADIANLPGVRIVPTTLQAAPADVFDGLQAGDVLFIDSSHILMPGSDVDLLFNRVLPAAPSGVMVHIHDIFLPFDYPPEWGWRAYNEQQGVAPLLTTGAYKPLFSSVWAERRLADRLAGSVVARLPRPADAIPASLWLEKC